VLSHTSALAVWRLAQQRDPVHVSVRAGRRALRRPGLVVHRVRDLVPDRLGPYPVTELARALVDTWGLAAGRDGGRRLMDLARGAVVTALRDRRLRPDALAVEIDRRPAVPGRAGLGRLVELVRSGSHSELEIWGVQHVLTGPGMPRITRQYAVSLPFATVHLDAAIPRTPAVTSRSPPWAGSSSASATGG